MLFEQQRFRMASRFQDFRKGDVMRTSKFAAFAYVALALAGTLLFNAPCAVADPLSFDPAEAAAGRQVFNKCISCHFIEPGKRGFAPNLNGVVERPAASLPDFTYSDALRNSQIIWTEDNLRKWVAGNDQMVPGTRMRHVAITDRAEQDYLIAFLKSLSSSAVLADRSRDAEILLAKAVDNVKKDGAEQAFATFNRGDGGFIKDELYVFVFDLKGKYMASGANPKLVGVDAHDLRDAAGKPLVHEMIEIAKSRGDGIVEYKWLNRADNRVEDKRSHVKRVGNYIVGVGYYLN